MEYTVKTNASPDGIIIIASKFWVDTYPDAWALIKSLDNLDLDPQHMVIMQSMLRIVSVDMKTLWEGLCKDLQLDEKILSVQLINDMFKTIESNKNRY